MEKGHSGKLFFLFYRGEVMRRFRGPWIFCWPASHAWLACKSEGPTQPAKRTQQQSHHACSILMSAPLH